MFYLWDNKSMSDHDEIQSEEKKPPLSYKVKTGGFTRAGLVKTESITRESPDGRHLHQVILFYHGEEGSEPKEFPDSIKIATYRHSLFNRGWYFDRAAQQWNGDFSDASLLEDVIKDKFPDSGKYQQLSGDEAVDGLAQTILAGKMPAKSAEQIIKALAKNPDAYEVFKDSDASQLLASTVNQYRQQQAIEELDTVARDPTSNENHLQKVLDKQWWMFGGRYIDKAKRRSLTVLDQLDVPLIRSDGSLHIVELKQANIPGLIRKHRNHLVVGDEVHEAVSQAMNYLLSLDEQRAQILTTLGIDARRASATIVIGHTDFAEGFTAEEVHETIRTYNSHLSRIEVITFDELIDGAHRSLDFSL
jgi:hypothetical protein